MKQDLLIESLVVEAPSEEVMNRDGLGTDDHYKDLAPILAPDPVLHTAFPGCLVAPIPILSKVMTCIWTPFLCIFCACGPDFIKCIPERTHAAVLYYGKYVGSIQEPGIHFAWPCGLELRTISTATRTMDMKDLKIVDLRGNPVIVSAVVTYEATSARRARVDVGNPWPNPSWDPTLSGGTYLQLQAQAVLKQVVSQFPYEAPNGLPSLQTEGAHISDTLIQSLQKRVNITGAKIISFDLVDLSYAPEIAAHMLVRQQAAALVDARRVIVRAAVDMTHDAIEQLNVKGLSIDESTQNKIISNLLTVICSNEAVKPVVHMGSS